MVVLGLASTLMACGGADGGLATLPQEQSSATVHVDIATALSATTTDPGGLAATTTTGIAPESTDPPGIVTLAVDGPWRRIAGSPHVETAGLFYELLPGLVAYLPVVEDVPNHVLWILREEEREIIEAYLQARLVFYRSAAVDPMDTDDPGWDRWYAGSGGNWYRQLVIDRRAAGEYLELEPAPDHGVLLRPQVLGEERSSTHALVFDCVVDGSEFVSTGTTLEQNNTDIAEVGIAARMDLIDGEWRITEIGSTDLACMD